MKFEELRNHHAIYGGYFDVWYDERKVVRIGKGLASVLVGIPKEGLDVTQGPVNQTVRGWLSGPLLESGLVETRKDPNVYHPTELAKKAEYLFKENVSPNYREIGMRTQSLL